MINRIANEIEFDPERAVWKLIGGGAIPYSDGKCTEAYLRKVLKSSADLSSKGHEIERHILDWSTQYNLSSKRTQLLRGFKFDRHDRVLEVGCGCGAITRFLGETFDDVVAIEGSLERAAIARLRTRDQPNVHIVNAPFQAIEFNTEFDLIFCVGVFEYAEMFVDAENPHDYVMKQFHDILSPDGALILAVENQFGLTYFCSNREDHTGIMFNGIEGYHRTPGLARTLGYCELKECVHKYFPNSDFYFPYPDYKLPSCIISEELLHRIDVSELIGRFASAPAPVEPSPLFDAGLALAEISRNGMVPFFANSFLVVAGKGGGPVSRDWLGILYSTARRRPELRTCTRIVDEGGSIAVIKELLSGKESTTFGNLTLKPCCQPWVEGRSLAAEVVRLTKNRRNTLDDILKPTLSWYAKLESLSVEQDNVYWVDGRYLDAIWSNTIIDGERVDFIDLEWQFHGTIRLSYVVMRAFYDFFRDRRENRAFDFQARRGSLRNIVKDAARMYGLRITSDDFRYFISMNLDLEQASSGDEIHRSRRICAMKWRLCTNPSANVADSLLGKARWFISKLRKRAAVRSSRD